MVIAKKPVVEVEVALELVQEHIRHQSLLWTLAIRRERECETSQGSSLLEGMPNLSCYSRVLDFEQLRSKQNLIRGRLKETYRTASLRLWNK